ncbi:MAG: 16S rRNA (guanine(527)-N(7))-methyltransferase RsmG [Syntrophomonadaceae bacterium]|jgi:16S rRNA (guanine527-N7)-methyltransferase|nr:16S rRNA (guanine(527)-N(7))-methyltransferase RsmG [Syntrophomonadaceae bacterium]
MENKIALFKELLLAENRKHNLVSRATIETDLDEHIEDSRRILGIMKLKGQKVVDIGSGAGFPGLILAICEPEAEFTLLESNQKKSRFLVEAAEKLRLKNTSVNNERAETASRRHNQRGRFDIGVARAVAKVQVLLEYGLPLIKTRGRAVFWKGVNYPEELSRAQNALNILGGRLTAEHKYFTAAEKERVLLEFTKIKPTPDNYPRRTGIPAKNPL